MPVPELKRASITIRLSKVECEQLHKRATEAGLTVSAYLRSCTFEAEALRAQVKQVLADLRKSTATQQKLVPVVETRSENRKIPFFRAGFDRLLRFLPRWHAGQRIARA